MIFWLWWAQLIVDILLLVAVIALFRTRGSSRAGRVSPPADLDSFLAEAGRLSQEFDRLLAEKRELVAGTLATLDARIAQLKRQAAELEPPPAPGAQPARRPASSAQTPSPAPAPALAAAPSFRERVLDLHRQGQSPQQIAQATGRPRGEVELVLSLAK